MKDFIVFLRRHFIFISFVIILTVVSLYAGSKINTIVINSHIELQAKSLIELKLELISPPLWLNDVSLYEGKYFSPFGVFPSILFIPIVLLIPSASQLLLSYLAFPITYYFAYKLARILGTKNQTDALWIATFFTFGSLYLFLSLTNISVYIIQIISTLLLLLALCEYFSKGRLLVVGFLVGLLVLTRPTLIFSVTFFTIELFLVYRNSIKKLVKKLALLFFPIFFALLIVGMFNFFRFGNILDNGYDHNFTHAADLRIAREFGFFSPAHIPGNIYLMIFKGPEPIKVTQESFVLAPPYMKIDYWGLGIFYTTPLFLYLLITDFRKKYAISALATSLIMLVPILMFYAYGAWQYGYRHIVDIYPFLLLLLILTFKDRLPTRAKLLIIYGIIFNLFFMYSIWNTYPFFPFLKLP